MSCDEALALAPILPTGALEPEELAELEAHLLGCGACRARADGFARAVRPLAQADQDPVPPRVWAGIVAGIAAAPPEKPAPEPVPEPQLLAIALACTFCHDGLRRDQATYCASCLAPHHRECFATHGRCSAPGCAETHVVRAGRAERPVRRWRIAFVAAALASAAAVAAWTEIDAQRQLRSDAERIAMRALREADAARAEVQLLLEAARRREAERDFDGAIQDYSRVLELSPESWTALSGRGRALLGQGSHAQAQLDLERATELNPYDAPVRISLATALLHQGRLDQARSAAKAAIELAPAAPIRSDANLVLAAIERQLAAPSRQEPPPTPEARVIMAELAHIDSGTRARIDAGQSRGVRRGDVFAVTRAGQMLARLTIDEVRPNDAAGRLLLLDRASPVLGDPAILVTDDAVWEATRRGREARAAVAGLEEKIRDGAGGSRLRVVYVDRIPRWEYRYLKNLLIGTDALSTRVWLLTADKEFSQDHSPGLKPLTEPPRDYSDVDVLVLGDIDAAHCDRPAIDALLARGGGLVLLPDSSVTPVLAPPGLLDLSPARLASEPFQVGQVDFRGLDHTPKLLKSWYDPELPTLFDGLAASLTPDGRALAVDREGRPILSIREVGPGRVLQVGVGDTWRWRSDRGSPPHAAFWLETLGIAGGRLEERRDAPARPIGKQVGVAEVTRRSLAERLEDGLALLERGSYAEALQRFNEVLDDPAAMPSDLERIRTQVADVTRRHHLLGGAKTAVRAGRDEEIARFYPQLELMERWLPADHPSLAEVNELRQQVAERLKALPGSGH